jgi:Protein of unknown function (DUF1573)
MKNSTFFLVLSILGVFAVVGGWLINHQTLAKFPAYLEKFDKTDKVTAANLGEHFLLTAKGGTSTAVIEGGELYNFGMLPAGADGDHVFVVKNAGSAPLELRLGATTCKCTLGKLTKDKLLPGELTEVTVSWSVKTNEDKFGQEAQLLTNDPNKPAIRLRIEGRVSRQFEAVPSAIVIGTKSHDEVIQGEAVIYSFVESEVNFVSAQISDSVVNELAKIRVDKIDRSEIPKEYESAKAAFRLSLELKPGMPQGSLSQNVAVSFESSAFASADEPEETTLEQAEANKAAGKSKDPEVDKPGRRDVNLLLTGSIVGELQMVTTSKLHEKSDGGYLYNFGKLPGTEVAKGKGLVMIRGSAQESAKLRIESVYPQDVVSVKLGDPLKKSSMTLVPIEIEIQPSDKPVDYLGLSGDDKSYGLVMITTDREDGPKMPLYLKFQIDAK